MKRFLAITLKILLSVVALATTLVLAFVGVLLVRPQWILQDRWLKPAAQLASKAGIELSWNRGHLDVESLSLLEKRLHLAFDDLCVRMKDAGIDACFKHVELSVTIGLRGRNPMVTEVGPVTLLGGHVAYQLVESEPKPETPKDSAGNGNPMPTWLRQARWLPIRIEVGELKADLGETQIAGAVDVTSSSATSGAARIDLQARARTLPGKQSAELDLELSNPKGYATLDGWGATARAKGALPDGTRVTANTKLKPRGGQLDYDYELDVRYSKARARAQSQLRGQLSPEKITALITGEADHLVPQINGLKVEGCMLSIARRDSETQPGEAHVNCPVSAAMPPRPPGVPRIELPVRAGVRVVADLKTSVYPPMPDAAVDGKVEVEILPMRTPMLEAGGKVESVVVGVPTSFPKDWKMDTELGLRVKVSSFERLVKQLGGTPYDVWAPLRVLKGQVLVEASGRFDANAGTAPIRLQTRLASETQKLDLDANGTFRLLGLTPTPRTRLEMDLALTDVRLELPPLPKLPAPSDPTPDPLPQMLPDSRIKAAAPPQQAGRVEPAFTYDLKVHTPDDNHPIRLVTGQLKDPVPLAVGLHLVSGGEPEGSVRVLRFPFELFRRSVKMDHLNIALASPSKDSELDGLIEIPYSEYTIRILLLGTISKPQMRFMSDPPLPDDQIIAVLIFGRKIDALDPDQQQSVGNSRAALREGALNLFALYYLSALNVESIDYDPGTRTASMRYRLAEGTSLNLSQGAGGGQPSVGLRKRLSKHFAITTTLNNPSERQARRTVSTFLEWAFQY